MSDLDAAKRCQAIYAGSAGFDRYTDGQVIAGITKLDIITIVTFRGSDSIDDWVHDFDAFPTSVPDLGQVHAGFYAGLPAWLAENGMYLGGAIYLEGHSLGAARAAILAGLLAAQGHPASMLTMFGCPKPGFSQLAGIIGASPTQVRSYRNGADPVPEVPLVLPGWQHVAPWKQIGKPRFLLDVGDHYMANYIDSLQCWAPSSGGMAATG